MYIISPAKMLCHENDTIKSFARRPVKNKKTSRIYREAPMKQIKLNVEEFTVESNTRSILLEPGQEYQMTGSFVVFPDDHHGVLINLHAETTVTTSGGWTEGTFKVYKATEIRCGTSRDKVMIGVPHGAGKIPVIYIK